MGFNLLKFNGREITLTYSGFNLGSELSPMLLSQTTDLLKVMATNTSVYLIDEEILGIPVLKLKAIASYTTAFGALIVGIISTILGAAGGAYPLDGWYFFVQTLRYSAPITAVFIVLTAILLRGRSAAHKDLGRLAMLSVFAFPILINGIMFSINIYKDSSTPQAHNVGVIDKYTTRSKSTTYYHVVVASWRPGCISEETTVNFRDYNNIIRGRSRMLFVTRQGALGYEWVTRCSLIRDASVQNAPCLRPARSVR